MKNRYSTKSSQETKRIAKEFASQLRGGEVLALYGDLGAGKTTFTQGLALGLGVTKHINSPTFIIHRTYAISDLKIKQLHHIDLYRIEKSSDVSSLGLEELLQEQDAVVVIEWPEKMGELLPEKRTDVQFEYVGENERKVSIKTRNPNIEIRNKSKS